MNAKEPNAYSFKAGYAIITVAVIDEEIHLLDFPESLNLEAAISLRNALNSIVGSQEDEERFQRELEKEGEK